MALHECSSVFFEWLQCCIQVGWPVYPLLRMWQRVCDELFTLLVVISQMITWYTHILRNVFCPRYDVCTRCICLMDVIVLVFKHTVWLIWQIIVTMQMSFTTFNLFLLDCSKYCSCSTVLGDLYIITIVTSLICNRTSTGTNDVTGCETHREAGCGPVIHIILDIWHYEVLWSCAWTRTVLHRFYRLTRNSDRPHGMRKSQRPVPVASEFGHILLWNVGEPEERCFWSRIFYIPSNLSPDSQDWYVSSSIFYISCYGSWKSEDWYQLWSIFDISSYGSAVNQRPITSGRMFTDRFMKRERIGAIECLTPHECCIFSYSSSSTCCSISSLTSSSSSSSSSWSTLAIRFLRYTSGQR